MPRNIYGVTKIAAEDLCELVHRDHGLPCVVLRTSRFFPEGDDRDDVARRVRGRERKANEYLYRRVDIEDVVERAPARAGARAGDRLRPLHRQRHHAVRPRGRGRAAPPTRRSVVRRLFPDQAASTRGAAGRCSRGIDRVYVNARARAELGWEPRYDFRRVLDLLKAGEDPRSPLARAVGAKGYHAVSTGPYTVR